MTGLVGALLLEQIDRYRPPKSLILPTISAVDVARRVAQGKQRRRRTEPGLVPAVILYGRWYEFPPERPTRRERNKLVEFRPARRRIFLVSIWWAVQRAGHISLETIAPLSNNPAVSPPATAA
jgi:hypothetical protein